MGLKALTNDGHLEWECHNGCGPQRAHVSHEGVQWTGTPGMAAHTFLIGLPPCPICGSRMALKAHFTEAELGTPNMWLPWDSERETRLQLLQHIQVAGKVPEEFARVGYTMDVVRTELTQLTAIKATGGQATPSRAVAERHMQLVGHMEKAGKSVPAQ